jgi:hypothetical protein
MQCWVPYNSKAAAAMAARVLPSSRCWGATLAAAEAAGAHWGEGEAPVLRVAALGAWLGSLWPFTGGASGCGRQMNSAESTAQDLCHRVHSPKLSMYAHSWP